MRLGFGILFRERPEISEPRSDKDRRDRQLRSLRTAGRTVAQSASSQLKKFVLELGGSDPFIVLEDADIEAASTGAVAGRFINNGQSCIATKRIFVVKQVLDKFLEKFVKKTRSLKVG